MAKTSANPIDVRIPLVPVRQFVVSFPPPLRLWLAQFTTLATTVCSKAVPSITMHLGRQSDNAGGLGGFVVFMQRFGSAGNLQVHLHIIALDSTDERKSAGRLKFVAAAGPTEDPSTELVIDIGAGINWRLRKKGPLEDVDGMPVIGDTEESFAAVLDEVHLPAQAVSVPHSSLTSCKLPSIDAFELLVNPSKCWLFRWLSFLIGIGLSACFEAQPNPSLNECEKQEGQSHDAQEYRDSIWAL